MGETSIPIAFMHAMAVQRLPLSADVRAATCFLPLKLTTFWCLPCTMIIQISSTLNIRLGECLTLFISFSRIEKNYFTFSDGRKPWVSLKEPCSYLFQAAALLFENGCGN
jgi:hypothetical protein